jgi:hypothetical protein
MFTRKNKFGQIAYIETRGKNNTRATIYEINELGKRAEVGVVSLANDMFEKMYPESNATSDLDLILLAQMDKALTNSENYFELMNENIEDGVLSFDMKVTMSFENSVQEVICPMEYIDKTMEFINQIKKELKLSVTAIEEPYVVFSRKSIVINVSVKELD